MRKTTIWAIFSILAILSLLLSGCAAKPADADLILATTTSTQDSGLLDELLPVFQKNTGYNVKVVAVGTGQALKMGEEGNADVLLVHAPASEKALVEKGFAIERALVMHNDFIIVGPAADPAGIRGMTASVDALAKIAAAQANFVSRGDDSGTHKAELALWKKASLAPGEADAWYISTGQGMGATLTIASEKQAYCLTDRATYLASKDLGLEILVEKEPALLNVYHVMVVNPEKWPETNVEGARAFAQFLVSDEAQKLIGEFGVDKYGQQLFVPDADNTDADLGL